MSGFNRLNKGLGKIYQKGATMWTTLSVVLMVGFMGMLAFQLIPIYLEHANIKSSMQEIVNQSNFKQLSQREIMTSIQKRLMIDSIRGFDTDAFKVVVTKTNEKIIVIDYSKKVSIAGNVSALVEFNDELRPTSN